MNDHVIVVGGGPSGLSVAIELRRRGVDRVTVFEREREAGGVPRHTDHLGFGMRDLHRLMTGPRYARRLVTAAEHAGVQLRTSTTVAQVSGSGVILVDGSPIDAGAVILATGVRERPRAARLVPGDRPAGVFTTGTVQQLTALHHRRIGQRAVIVGAEQVSFSAIWSLRHGDCTPVAMVTPLPHHQAVAVLRHLTATVRRVPVLTGVDIAAIEGRRRVKAVVLSDGRRIACDTVVFTGDFIPDHELAHRAGLAITAAARAPAIAPTFATSRPGVFAIGNLVHPAETADVCALDGRAAAASVLDWLTTGSWPAAPVAIAVDDPIMWASFNSRGLTLRVSEFISARVQVCVGERVVATGRKRRLVPNRAITVPLDHGAGDADTLDRVRDLRVCLVR